MLRGNAVSLFAFTLCVLLAQACAAPAVSMNGSWDRIEFELKSWGRLLTTWTMSAKGGSWTEIKEDKSYQDDSRLVHRIDADPDRYRRLSAVLARLPLREPDCKDRLPDFPYGTIRLTRGTTTIEFTFDSGCQGERYGVFLDVIKEADAMVIDWGKTGAVVESAPQ